MSALSAYLTRVASAYAAARHEPEDATVTRCYRAFTSAIEAQYRALCAFVDVRFVASDPYTLSAPMWADLSRGRLSVYTFAELPSAHPMRAAIPYDGGEIAINLAFRAVHDAFAHYPERLHHDGLDAEPGYDEFRAFRAHVRLMAGNADAIRALFTETVAQNATYHYGAHPGTFAAQRACVLPEALILQALTLEI